jgi:murein DD-endopeptidase MepM/ murein hydrolase activator NlpD
VVKGILRSVAYGVVVLVFLVLGLRIVGPASPQLSATARVSPAPPAAPQQKSSGDAAAREQAAAPAADDVLALRERSLLIPVEGVAPGMLRDTFAEGRVGHLHEAVDILAPRGTKVLAVDQGRVVKLFNSVRGGLTVYQFDVGENYCYYYAHLDGYVPWLQEGAVVQRGAVLGYVGTTGNAPKDTPHLHFSIFKLGPERRWWEGTAINPYGIWAPRGDAP